MAARTRTGLAARLALVAGSILFTLFAVEIGCRLLRGPAALWSWKNYVLDERRKLAERNQGSRFTLDPTLGYVQRAGYDSENIHYDADGFRVVPPLPAGARPGLVLATGDSFTQGDEVADAETWPAILQAALGQKVVNAGVAAYGIDQTVLRTEQLAARLRPSLVIVGFIADDLRRAEMSRTWGAPKPYFEPRPDGTIELRNVPVPPPPNPADTLDFWQRAFGWSIALDTFLEMKGWRYEWVIDHQRALPPGTGERLLACPLMQRLAALGIPVLVVAQYDFYVWVDAEFGAEQHRQSKAVLACAEKAGLAAVDTYEATEKAVKGDGLRTVYRAWHPGPVGYRLIAREIEAGLARKGYIPPR